jgi:hypothetical protein
MDGQSLNILPGPAVCVGSQLKGSLPNTAIVNYNTVAIGSTSWAELSQTQTSRSNRHAHSTALPILSMALGGTSDVLSSDTASTIYTTIKTYALAAKSAGFSKVLVGTITPSTGFSGAQDTKRKSANDLIIGNADSAFDAVCDLASDSSLSNPGAPHSGTTYYGSGNLSNPANTTYYNADGLHFKTAGCIDAAASLLPAFQFLGAS